PWARPRRRARRARRPRNRPVPAAPPPHPRPLDARSFFGSPPPYFPLAVCSEFGVPNIGEHTPPPPGGAEGSTEPFRTVRRRRASRLPARHPRARPAPTRRPIPPDHIRCRSISEERSGASRHGAWPRPPRRPVPLRHGALARSPTPARSRLADPFPRSHPLPVDIGGTERRVPPRCPDLAPSRRPGRAPPAPRHGRSSAPRASPPFALPPCSVPPGVGAEREGALGAASALDGVIGHDAVEEPVAAARVGGAQVTAVGRGAQRVPPIHD